MHLQISASEILSLFIEGEREGERERERGREEEIARERQRMLEKNTDIEWRCDENDLQIKAIVVIITEQISEQITVLFTVCEMKETVLHSRRNEFLKPWRRDKCRLC